MQNTMRVTTTSSPLHILVPSLSQWHRSLSLSLPQGTSLQTATELSCSAGFQMGTPLHRYFIDDIVGGVDGSTSILVLPPLSTTQLYDVVILSPGWLCPHSLHFIQIPQDAASACLVMLATSRFYQLALQS